MYSQTQELHGQLIAVGDVEGIHISNRSTKVFTISNYKGEFTIPAKLYDTLHITGIAYKSKELVVTESVLNAEKFQINLEELVYALDQVEVGKVLTGDLLSDLNNSKLERSINFYDLGIPGYTGKPKTQSERRLYTAGDFKAIHLLSLLGGSLDVDPIINAISGRTKRMKNRVHFEKQNSCLDSMISKFSARLFVDENDDDFPRYEFFYYCLEDSRFDRLCAENNEFNIFTFLQEKLSAFSKIQTNADN